MPPPTKRRSRVKVTFDRNITLFDAVMLGVGGLIGGGIFALAGFSVGYAGPAVILVFVLNGLLMSMTALSYAELGSMIHEAGGGYRHVDISMPPPFGFLAGWMGMFARTVACSLYAITFGTFALAFPGVREVIGAGDPDTAVKLMSVVAAVVMIAVNYLGAAISKRAENILTTLQLIVIAVFVITAVLFSLGSPATMENFQPFFAKGTTGLLVAMGFTYITFEGTELTTSMAEEIREPERTIPRAIFISLWVTVAIYVVMIVAAISLMPWQALSGARELAMVRAGEVALGPSGIYLLVVGGAISAISAFNAAIMASSRVAFAMGRRGHLPRALARIHGSSHSPTNAVMFMGAIIIVMVLFIPLESIAAGASLLFLLTFILVNAALIVLRRKDPDARRGFRVPLFPVPPLVAIVVNALLAVYLYTLDQVSWYIAILWIEIGLIAYYRYGGEREVEEKVHEVTAERALAARPACVSVLTRGWPIHDLGRVASAVADGLGSNLHLIDIMEISKLTPMQDLEPSLIRRRSRSLERVAISCGHPHVDCDIVVSHEPVNGLISTLRSHRTSAVMFGSTNPPSRRVWGWVARLARETRFDRNIFLGEPKRKVENLGVVVASSRSGASFPLLMDRLTDMTRTSHVTLVDAGGGRSACGRLSAELQAKGLTVSVVERERGISLLERVRGLAEKIDLLVVVAEPRPSSVKDIGMRTHPVVDTLLRNVVCGSMVVHMPRGRRPRS